MSYGIKFNMALTTDGSDVTGGLHIVDSEGMDVSSESDGDSIVGVVTSLARDAAELIREVIEDSSAENCEEEEHHCGCCNCGSAPISVEEARNLANKPTYNADYYAEVFADTIRAAAEDGLNDACVYKIYLNKDEEIPDAVDEAIERFLAAGFSFDCDREMYSNGGEYIRYHLVW